MPNEKTLKAIEKLRKAKYCFGITSDTDIKNYHVLFFDFDDIYNLDKVANSLLQIQAKYHLSTIYILKSNNGFNAFCLSIAHIDVAYHILRNTKFIDALFVELGYNKNNCYILRMDFDKKPVMTLSNDDSNFLSNSHKWFFKNIMGFDIEEKHIYDDNYKFRIVAYKSVKYGYVNLYD